MWKLLVFGGILGAVLGQDAGTAFDWGTLLGGAIGSSPAAGVLLWRLTKADNENARLADEVRNLHAQTIAVAERMAPLLADATRTLNEVRSGLEAAMERGRPRKGDETDVVVQRLEAVLTDFQRDLQRRPSGERQRNQFDP